ncbi:glycosyltransferase family 4 protein [Streptomyces sp. NPDC049837]|uniref:glycosyltransferase family 4 protein n=1 Tax=Streptomyces sp. NPDC049837 TaxID=3155277 RepID=UPI00344827DB
MSLRRTFPDVTHWRGRHVVVCNWRDGRHPEAGGAELYCEQVAQQLHDAGVRVTYVTARPRGTARREQAPYGTVVRGGGRFSVYLFALLWLAWQRRRVDAVIDSQNGIPFFTPLVLPRRTPVVLLVHHVHQQQFAVLFPRAVAVVGRWLEATGSRLVYGRRAICAVSPSSRAQTRTLLGLRGPVHLAPPGLTAIIPQAMATRPRIVCTGRLVRHKRLDHLIRALPALRENMPGVELHLIGDGEAREELARLAERLGVGDRVVFHGRLPVPARDALVASAWITASASPHEGWGLSVMEAAGAGVPAVAYDVPGLRDVIRHGVTGWLVREGEQDLTTALVLALRTVADPGQAAAISTACRAWAGRFTWSATAGHLLAALTAEQTRLRDRDRGGPPSDSCAVVTLPNSLLLRADSGALRVTDLITVCGPDAALLLTGADEQDAYAILTRMGLDASDPRLRVRLARPGDLLGWQRHPGTGGPGPEGPLHRGVLSPRRRKPRLSRTG